MSFFKKSIFKSYMIVSAGSAVGKLAVALTSLLLARWMSVTEFGRFSAVYAAMTFMAQIPMALDSAFVSGYSGADSGEKPLWFRGGFFAKAGLMALMAGLILIFGEKWAEWIFGQRLWGEAARMGLFAGVLWGFFSICSSVFQAEEKFVRVSVLLSAPLIACFLLVVLGGLSDGPLTSIRVLGIHLGVFFVASVVGGIWIFQRVGLRPFPMEPLRRMVSMSLWLFPAFVCFLLYQRLDIFMLSRWGTSYDTGIYAAAQRVGALATLLGGSVPLVFLPKASAAARSAESLAVFLKEAAFVIGFMSVGFLALIFAAPWIAIFLFGAAFADSTPYMRWLLGAGMIMNFASPFHYLFYAWKKPQWVFGYAFMQGLSAFLLGIFLIPRFGPLGAAWTMAAAAAVGASYVYVGLLRGCRSYASH